MKSRIRTFVSLAAVLTVLGTLAAAPADAGWWPMPSWANAAKASSVPAQMAAGAAAGAAARSASTNGGCGAGMVALTTDAGVYCHHQVSDLPFPTTFQAAGSVQPKCHGNGQNGPRVHLIYGYIEGQPNQAARLVPQILKEWVPAMEANFRLASKEQGREIGVRYFAPDCKIRVDVLQLPADVGSAPDFSSQIIGAANAVTAAGYEGADNLPLVWLDTPSAVGGPGGGPCGVAIQSVNRFLPVTGDNVTPVNSNNLGNVDALTSVAFALRNPSRATDRGPLGPSRCWGGFTETHELLHTLGAVQFSSPNSDGAGHCSDGNDIMCDPAQVKVVTRCQSRVPMMDCGMDDYFAISPAAGSYLSTHWNTANSRFLGDAIGFDAIPAVLPPL